ncbi:hypothetical protein B0H13DRAFT_2658210 [Mycena leptocephala]|nr:hypothetical protein B0H13DRAFT_2658210 [Mycena leptocephala]
MFPSDTRTLKSLVYGLFVLDILQTAMVTADAFHWFVYGFGNMDRLNDTFLNSWDVPLLDAAISLVVQGFYCWRIHVLRKSFILPILIAMVSVTQCVAGIVTAVKAHQLGKLSLISTEVVEQTIWLVGSAVADLAIAVVLSWTVCISTLHIAFRIISVLQLLRARNKRFQGSHGIITRIVYLTVETNALTAGVALIGLILFLAVPQHSTLVVPPTAIIGKLYTNCLIAVLNNRPTQTRNLSSNQFAGATGSMPAFRIAQAGIDVERTQKVDMDPLDSSMEMSDMHVL